MQRNLAAHRSVRAVVWRATTNPLNILFMSRRVESMLGYKADAFIQEPDLFFELIHEKDLVHLRKAIEDAIHSKKCGDIQYRLREKTGA